ncbi:MAG: rhamnose:proton symporter, partial [Verrucomicrobia bacterium]|nr:rhamnose:proton symporter [Verrucomicrobiota bacterium]
MNPIAANPLLGVGLHAIGATFAATCYTPQKKVRGWSWQTYWLVQASFCWFLLPILGAWLTIPDLVEVLREAPKRPMLISFGLGAAYGIGGTAFGISIRHIGFSLTYAIAVGLSSVLGTLIPPLVKGTLMATLHRTGADWVVAGIVVGTVGIALTGWAGRMKELDLTASGARGE